ncbi:hypothetical protein RSAG8_03118, partial [Rhizoctonia solani AG-8 WAC10335]
MQFMSLTTLFQWSSRTARYNSQFRHLSLTGGSSRTFACVASHRQLFVFSRFIRLAHSSNMATVDTSIYPHATGNALKTVEEHSGGDVDKAELIFYSGWFCPFVQRAWIALEEKG